MRSRTVSFPCARWRSTFSAPPMRRASSVRRASSSSSGSQPTCRYRVTAGGCRSRPRCCRCRVIRRDRPLGGAHEVDLVGAVGEARPTGVQEHVGERRVLGVAERAVHLDRAVDDAVERVRDEVLRHRHLALEVFLAIDLVRRVQHHELALVELDRRLGDHPLDALLLREQRAVREAVERAVDHHVERDLGLRDPAHAVREPGRAEAVLAEQVALPAAAEHLVVVHAEVFDADLGVAAGTVHRLDLADLGPAVGRAGR